MRISSGRYRWSLLVASLLPLAGCGGELYLNADDAITEFDPFDRDPSGDDDADGGDGTDDGSGDDGDFDGDSILGDGFGDFDGDGGGGGCGFNPDPCPGGQECVEGACVTVCPVPRCEVSRACCGAGTECVFDRFCLPACPNAADERCGGDGSVCCNSTANQICGPSLTCVQDCTGQGPLCGTGTAPSFGSVCCDANNLATSEDDDVCVFNRCVARGGECESFLDCEAGEYCELTLHQETGGEPDTGYCLPNDFPPDAPICQAAPSDLFSPTTEWSWVGVQLVGADLADTDFSDNFVDGQVIPPCANAASTNCYREPCTDNPTTAAPAQTGNFRSQCFRSVETIPTTADVDQVDLDPAPASERFVPEVVFKAYADNTFGGVNLLVIADGRADEDLPASGSPPTKQQRSKVVIYGETRGHVAIGNLDGDRQLELVAAHRNGICAYDPFDGTGAPVANALKWCDATGSLNTSYSGGAPHLADLNADGVVEIVIAGVILRDDGASATVLVDLGAANQAAESNTGNRCSDTGECFAVSAVADVNLDGFPELLAGDRAWTIRRNPSGAIGVERITGTDGWVADRIWSASYRGGSAPQPLTIGEGRGFPGVADFVDNTQPPYNRPTNTPEVAIVYAGAAYILSGETGEVLQSPVSGSTTNLAFQLLNNRGGPPNIADFDGDGRPEVSFAGTGCMVVVDPDCAAADAAGRVALVSTPGSGCNVAVPTVSGPQICNVEVNAGLAQELGVLWQYQTQDQSSAVTGTSVFDFQGDGRAEVLYNDECFFRVFEGATSNILYERPNSHRTATEYPIVVDVDGDSNSEIVVVSTGDQSSSESSPRDRCGGPPPATPTTCNGLASGACNGTPGCRFLLGACAPYAYRRGGWEIYQASACDCSDHDADGAAACNAARGCAWDGDSCEVVTQATCNGFDVGATTDERRAACQVHVDDCLWDPFQGASGECEENPRGQAYVCQQSTWGVTVFGDTSDLWVKTLPYWYEHPYHITNQDRSGTVVPDWSVCYSGSQCAAQTDPVQCEETFVSGSSGALCEFGDPNPDFYNNFRQNVPGFVPLNAPDLQIETAIGGLAACPPQVTIIARVVNKGRAGILAGTPIGFYRLLNEAQTVQATAATTAFATVALPVDLLPGGGVEVSAIYTVPAAEAPINLDFRVIANPPFILSQPSAEFECNANNNFRDVLDLDCTDVGG